MSNWMINTEKHLFKSTYVIFSSHPYPPLLSHYDRRQAEVDISMVANIRKNPLDPRNPWWGFWYMAWDAVADISQGWERRI